MDAHTDHLQHWRQLRVTIASFSAVPKSPPHSVIIIAIRCAAANWEKRNRERILCPVLRWQWGTHLLNATAVRLANWWWGGGDRPILIIIIILFRIPISTYKTTGQEINQRKHDRRRYLLGKMKIITLAKEQISKYKRHKDRCRDYERALKGLKVIKSELIW